MKKRSFANSRCAESVVRTATKTETKVKESLDLDGVRPESYRRKKRELLQKLRDQTQAKASPGAAEAEGWFKTPALEKQREQHLNSLEALSYQAHFSTLVSTRKEALEGLVAVDRVAEITLQTLEGALEDPVPEIRAKAAELLRESPPPLPESMTDKLIARAWDPEIIVRKEVALTLASHPDPRAIGPLMGLLGTQNDELREIVHQSLVEICTKLGPPPPRTDGDT